MSYKLLVYKTDLRCRKGLRLVKTIDYPGTSGDFMMEEMYDLRNRKFKREDGFILDFEPLAN